MRRNTLIANTYLVKDKIGEGSFGSIFVVENAKTKRQYALKQEKSLINPQLPYEAKLYDLFNGGVCIPRVHWVGVEKKSNMMVMDLLGKSIESLFNKCQRRLSLKTVLMLADQMISCLEFIHKKNFIHRDVKPENFVMGVKDKKNQVYIIDYGLAKRFQDPQTREHIPKTNRKSMTGTARYASVNALQGIEQSRRDDMESLGYIFVYLLKGSLPWMNLKCKNNESKCNMIERVKSNTTLEVLCSDLPFEFLKYFQIVKHLGFSDEPPYAEMRKLFRRLFRKQKYTYDFKYDWVIDNAPRSCSVRLTPERKIGHKSTKVNDLMLSEESDDIFSETSTMNHYSPHDLEDMFQMSDGRTDESEKPQVKHSIEIKEKTKKERKPLPTKHLTHRKDLVNRQHQTPTKTSRSTSLPQWMMASKPRRSFV